MKDDFEKDDIDKLKTRFMLDEEYIEDVAREILMLPQKLAWDYKKKSGKNNIFYDVVVNN